MTTLEEALKRAETLLDAEVRPGVDEEVVIRVDQMRESESFWVFFYNTKSYLEAGALSHMLAGNGPILVDKRTGVARIGRSDIPWEKQVGR